MTSTRRPASVALTALLLASLLVSCSTSSGEDGSGALGAPISPRSVTPSPREVARPTSPAQVDPHSGFGRDVFITAKGFRPELLLASTGVPITWHNVTGKARAIASENLDADNFASDPIPPGGSFSWRSEVPYSVVYHTEMGDKRYTGRLQLQFPFEA